MRRNKSYRDVDGILILDKSRGISSSQALQQVRHLYQARKAGHCGSLDPLATGVLPVCFGQATRFSSYLLGADKGYRARCRLGQTTTTADAEGEVIDTRPVNVDQAQVMSVMTRFAGDMLQTPPMHSALKHQGKRLYQLAREGKQVERKARPVTIHSIEFESLEDEQLQFLVRCSKGTYIRTLAEDIGEALGCGAHLSGLHRIEVDPFSDREAYRFDDLRNQAEQGADLDALLLPVSTALEQFPGLNLTQAEGRDICQGKSLYLSQKTAPGFYRLMVAEDSFIGLGEVRSDLSLVAKRLMNTAS